MKIEHLVLFSVAFVAACSSSNTPERRLLESEQDEELLAEQKRLRLLQEVRGTWETTLTVGESGPTSCTIEVVDAWVDAVNLSEVELTPTEVEEEVVDVETGAAVCHTKFSAVGPATGFADAYRDICDDEVIDGGLVPPPGACQLPVVDLCVAHKLLGAGSARTSAFQATLFSTGDVITVPPQGNAATAALFRAARDVVRDAAANAATAIENSWTDCGEPEHLVSTFVEAYHLYDETTERAVDAVLAVADAQRSWTGSVPQGIAWSVGGIEDPGGACQFSRVT